MKRILSFICAASTGASLMYFFDPDRGKRRRVMLRNKAKHLNRVATETTGKVGRDLRNRAAGVVSEAKSLFRTEEITDDVLEARIRSKLGRVVSHPHAVEAKAVEGRVILSGKIVSDEVHPLLDSVAEIRGVKNIENRLEAHDKAGDIPALQGGSHHEVEPFGPLAWSPTTKVMAGIAGIAGGALTIYGVKRSGMFG